MHHRTISGLISYTSKKPERLDQIRGRERFTYTVHTDGRRTLRALCEIEEPDPTVLRDVVYSIDADDRPMDCFIRLTIGDRFMGSGWFRMLPDRIECESYGPSIGRVSQNVPIIGEYDGFGTHPIVADGYLTRRMDRTLGPHQRDFRTFMPSPDHRGATPPLIADSTIQLAYIAEETITVAAGTFAARHFCFSDARGGMATDKGAHPEYNLWVTADEDSIFLQGGVGGYMQTWYELIELNR
jgi:hypothetical protein